MPGAARKGDAGVVHCSGFVIAGGSGDVTINGLPAARVGDTTTAHLFPARKRCGVHTAVIVGGSNSVFINGKPAARAGDPLSGCTRIAQGSSDVTIG
jgi:uncharacterized Zn-binding protein involved in type VI secretion